MKNQPTAKTRIFEKQIIGELRLSRERISLALPQENLEDYANSQRIRSAYRRVIEQYPPHLQ